jgi:hypothetical protein
MMDDFTKFERLAQLNPQIHGWVVACIQELIDGHGDRTATRAAFQRLQARLAEAGYLDVAAHLANVIDRVTG